MKIETRKYVKLDPIDKGLVLSNARDLDKRMSPDEFIEYIESLMDLAIDLAIKE